MPVNTTSNTASNTISAKSTVASVAVYARVSSERQARDNTIASQLAALRQRVHDDGCVWTEGLCFVDDGLLRNPAYCGRAAYGKTRISERKPRLRPQRGRPELPRRPGVGQPRPREEWIELTVPAIISPALFDTVAEQLRDNRQRQRARQPRSHLLQGLIVCQQCGYSSYVQSASGKVASGTVASGKVRYGYYRCIGCDRHRGDGQRLCHLPSMPQEPLEEAVWKDVRTLLADPHRIAAEYQRREQEQTSPSAQRQQLDLRRQRAAGVVKRLIDAYADDLLDKAEFEPRLRVAKTRLRDLGFEHKLLLETETREQDLRHVIRCLEHFAQRIQEGLAQADAALRRDLICALIKRVEIGIDEARIVYRIPLDPFDPGPSGGHLRHWVWRLDAALALSLYERAP